MIDSYILLKTLHILMVAVWLGTDMATFTAFTRMKDASLSLECRQEMGYLTGFLDMGPRSALILLLMLGITMTHMGGWGFDGPAGFSLATGAAVFGVLWLVGIWHQFWVDHPKVGETRGAAHFNFQSYFRPSDIWLRTLISGALGLTAIYSLMGDGPIVAWWLSVKLILFAGIVLCGVLLRVNQPYTRRWIKEIFEQGSTPEREAALARPALRAQALVLLIWVLIAIIVWITVWKG